MEIKMTRDFTPNTTVIGPRTLCGAKQIVGKHVFDTITLFFGDLLPRKDF
ncbi:hypothetical protein T235_12460 [Tannerella sp. oral taxon BU063 isolate Cell 8/11]|uniref:Uncharacterized protein n=1 Tax=Tannerella sp. oral taxon BU063 isolate Cell 8/11 TaxID=1411915 RepID=W2CXU8_9BACT|nr:hypothetical protein T235_12460 [Tannerella sp. oral taxon BU063 isolate Cell 8/11]